MMLMTNGFRFSHLARRSAVLLAVCATLQACGGGGGGDSTGTPAPIQSGNRAPTISGTPATTASVGQAYSFAPQAADADGNSLTFTVENLPSWATFNSQTGAITGTPAAANVGQFANITIYVSDGTVRTGLTAFAISVAAATRGTAALNWTPPTARTDGTSLTDLAGYRIRYGTSPDSYTETVDIDNPGLTSFVVEDLPAGTYYFTVTAVDSAGTESLSSNSASKTIG
jgi:hypothetical protein